MLVISLRNLQLNYRVESIHLSRAQNELAGFVMGIRLLIKRSDFLERSISGEIAEVFPSDGDDALLKEFLNAERAFSGANHPGPGLRHSGVLIIRSCCRETHKALFMQQPR